MIAFTLLLCVPQFCKIRDFGCIVAEDLGILGCGSRYLEGSSYIHIQGSRVVRTCLAFKDEGTLETVDTTYALTQHHVPEG